MAKGKGGGGNISQPRHMHQSAVAKSFSQFRLKPAVFPDGPSGCCALCSLKTTSFWPSVLWKKCVTPLYSPKTGKQLELQFPMKKLKLAQRHKTIMWENSEMGPQIITRHIMLHELSPRTPPPPPKGHSKSWGRASDATVPCSLSLEYWQFAKRVCYCLSLHRVPGMTAAATSVLIRG